MTTSNKSIEPILSQLDDWFQDITLEATIKQFSISDNTRDNQKLSTIVRTTNEWFKQLTDLPQVTYEGIEDEEDVDSQESIRDKANELARKKEDSHLESLAKDLELLLEEKEIEGEAISSDDVEWRHTTEYFTHYVHETDELSLLDETIGSCCTIEPEIKRAKLSAITRLQHRRLNQANSTNSLNDQINHPVVISSMQFNNNDNWNRVKESRGSKSSQRNNINDCDLINETVQCPMPLDHEYLPRPRAKPLVMSNRMYLRQRDGARLSRSKDSSVLNTVAIKRFARFSAELKILSTKHANVVGVSSNHRLVAIENN